LSLGRKRPFRSYDRRVLLERARIVAGSQETELASSRCETRPVIED
jgi:hypothetical protein